MARVLQNFCFFCLALAFLAWSGTVHAGFEVAAWDLLTFTQDRSADIPETDSERLTMLQNPLNHVSDTMIDPNTARTSYDFSWLMDYGTFDMDIEHHLETFRVRTVSDGHLLIEPDTDLRMTIDASLTYSSVPGDQAFVRLKMFVIDETTQARLFDESERGGNAAFEPASGTLAFAGDFTLPAGTTYRIDYLVDADNLSEPAPDGPIDTNGFIHFELSPVPEPSSAALVLLGTVLASRRRRLI